MENASKALIIAGAILLAIVIISLGLVVVNGTRDTINKTNLSEQEIQTFNNKFTSFEGTDVDGSNVNSLIDAVIASNNAEIKKGTTNFVTITVAKDTYKKDGTQAAAKEEYDEESTSFFRASNSKSYNVSAAYKNGLINNITISNK